MTAITLQDMDNAQLDAITLAEVANSRVGGMPGGSHIQEATTRLGDTINTVQGQLANLGFQIPAIDWTASTSVTSNIQVYRFPAVVGNFYVAKVPVPFTTGVSFTIANWQPLVVGTADSVVDTFSGDGIKTDFILSENPPGKENMLVYADGVYQSPSLWSLSVDTVSITIPPPAGISDNVVIITTRNASASETAAAEAEISAAAALVSETNAAISETNAAASAATINLPPIGGSNAADILFVNFGKTGYDFNPAIRNVETLVDLRLIEGVENQIIYLLGHTVVSNRGEGHWIWNSVSTASDDNGTVAKVAAVATGRWLRQFSRAIKPFDFGAIGDGIANDTVAVQATLDYGGDIEVFGNGSSYNLDQLIMDISVSRFVGIGLPIFNFQASSDTICVQFTSSVSPPYQQNGNGIYGIKFLGNIAKTQTCFDFSNLGAGELSHLVIFGCSVQNFEKGEVYGDDSYLIRHYHTDYFNNQKCLFADGLGGNSGENISFYGCTFFNSNNVASLKGPGSDFNFTACSFDFNTKIFEDLEIVKVFMSQCHIEYNHTVLNSLCNITGNRGSLIIANSVILGGPSHTSNDILGTITSGYMSVSNTYIHNWLGLASLYLFNNAGGTCKTFNNTFLEIDNISNGLYNNNTFHNLNAYITADTVSIVTARIGTNIILTAGGTSDRINVNKAGGNGSASSFQIFIPKFGATRLKVSISFLAGSIWTGDMSITTQIASNMAYDNIGLPILTNVQDQGVFVIDTGTIGTSATLTYISIEGDGNSEYFGLSFNLVAVNGGSTETLEIKTYGI